MEKYLFMKPVIDLFSEGSFFKKVFAIFLLVLAVFIAMYNLAAWIMMWKELGGLSSVTAIIGIIIFQLLYVLGLYMVVHAIFIRAGNISDLTDGDYTVISITSIFLKLCGEVYASFAAIISLGGGILIWFLGGRVASYYLNKMPSFKLFLSTGSDFVSGLVFIVGGCLVAFFVLAVFYFLSEAVVVVADIARNTKKGK